MEIESIYDRIKAILNKKNKSGNKMLIECGLNKSFLNDMKAKGTKPSIENILKISEYLNVSVDFLLTGNHNEVSHIADRDTRILVENYLMLDHRGRTAVQTAAYVELDRMGYGRFKEQLPDKKSEKESLSHSQGDGIENSGIA